MGTSAGDDVMRSSNRRRRRRRRQVHHHLVVVTGAAVDHQTSWNVPAPETVALNDDALMTWMDRSTPTMMLHGKIALDEDQASGFRSARYQ
jgi:hypothetical protein